MIYELILGLKKKESVTGYSQTSNAEEYSGPSEEHALPLGVAGSI